MNGDGSTRREIRFGGVDVNGGAGAVEFRRFIGFNRLFDKGIVGGVVDREVLVEEERVLFCLLFILDFDRMALLLLSANEYGLGL